MPEYKVEYDGTTRRAMVYEFSDFGREPIAMFFSYAKAIDYVTWLNKESKNNKNGVSE
jgi:hypothetical protein